MVDGKKLSVFTVDHWAQTSGYLW